MQSNDIKKFIRERLKGIITIILADGSSLNVAAIKGMRWNRDNQFNMWVISYNNGSSRLLDGNEIVSIAVLGAAIETNR